MRAKGLECRHGNQAVAGTLGTGQVHWAREPGVEMVAIGRVKGHGEGISEKI